MPKTLAYLSDLGTAQLLDAHRSGSPEGINRVIHAELRLRCSKPLSEFISEKSEKCIRKWCQMKTGGY
jgi:hypothetical protein